MLRLQETKEMTQSLPEELYEMSPKSKKKRNKTLKKQVSFAVKEKDTEQIPIKELKESVKVIKKHLRTNVNPNFIDIEDPAQLDRGAAVRFKNFQECFLNLTSKKNIFTQYDVIQIMLTYDSKYAIALLKANESTFYVRIYGLDNDEKYTEFMIQGARIKANLILQNMSANLFMLPYLDDGEFKILVFKIDGQVCDISLNNFVGIDNSTMPISGILDPMITAIFITNRLVFVTLFYRNDTTNWSLVLDIEEQQPVTDLISLVMDCSSLNFPIKCFYHQEKNLIYSFYRQGE